MNIEQLCNYDILLSFENESKKLFSLFKDDIYDGNARLNTCKTIANIGVEILDRYYRIFNSISFSGENNVLKRNSFIEALDGRTTNVLKLCRFCIEFLIYQRENKLEKTNSSLEEENVLFKLLCKVLFYQGDFLECSIVLERILGDYSEEEIFNKKIIVNCEYLFDFFSSWNLFNIRNSISANKSNDHIFGDLMLKELKLQKLYSMIIDEDNFEYSDHSNYTETIKEIKYSLIKIYRELKVKGTSPKLELQEKYNKIFENILLRIECCKKYEKKYLEIERYITNTNFEENYIKSIGNISKSIQDDSNNIFSYFKQIISLFGINNLYISFEPFQLLEEYINDLSAKLNVSNYKNEFKVNSDRRTRSKNVNNDLPNINLNKEVIEHDLLLGLENPLKKIIIDISSNTVTFPKYNDKQYKIWIQTIPYYCYNLILSILKKEEMKCDNIFSLNLNNNFPSIEQFDEMIIHETNFITEQYSAMLETKCVSFQDIKQLFDNLRHKFLMNFDEQHIFEVDNRFTFLSGNFLTSVDEFLLNSNNLLNKIQKFIFSTKNEDMMVTSETISTLLFSITEKLFKYTMGIITNIVDCTKFHRYNVKPTIRFQYSNDKSRIFDKNYLCSKLTSKLYYLLFQVNKQIQKEILLLFHSIMKTLIIFIFVTNNIISNTKSSTKISFYNELKSNFLYLLDTFTIIKEKLNNYLISEIDLSTKKLLIIFKVIEIPIVKIYLEDELVFFLKEDIMKISGYTGNINLLLKLFSDLDRNNQGGIISTGFALKLFSDNSIRTIKEKFSNWISIYNSKCSHEFPTYDIMANYSVFLDNNYLEYMQMKKINCNLRNEIIDHKFLQHTNSIILDINQWIKKFERFDLSENFCELLISLLKNLVLIINKDIQYLYFNNIIVNSIISNITKFIIKITEIYELNLINISELSKKPLHKLTMETILINISCIHKVFMNNLSANKLNILIMKNLINLLIALFDFFKYSSTIEEISSNSIINLIRYLTYLEFSFEFVKDENKELKETKVYTKQSKEDTFKRHILNNYCILFPIIEEQTFDFEGIYEINEVMINEQFDKFFNLTLSTKVLLLTITIKYGLFSNLSVIENWFKEIYTFVQVYKINSHLKNWNLLYHNCRKVVENYSVLFCNLNMKKLYEKIELEKYCLFPEQETEYLELLGIQFQLLYGLPVCPLPSMPFNKMAIYNQSQIYDYLFDLKKLVSNTTNFKNLFINWIINLIKNNEFRSSGILEYISPYSPLIILSCNIFQTLINCTSLTERQYSDSKVKFYTSIIGLVERLFFNLNNLKEADAGNIWNIIASPLIYPLFMETLSEILNSQKFYFDTTGKTLLQDDFSSILYNSQVSDQILNYYDNIMVLSPSFSSFEMDEFEVEKHGFEDLLFDEISIYIKENNLVIASLEPLLYSKYYYTILLDRFMKSNLDIKYLSNEFLDETLVQIRSKAESLISFPNGDNIFLKINWKNNIKKFIPFRFIKDCFISCIPVSYMDRSSSLWSPGRFGVTGNNNIQLSLSTLFKYLKLLNMNLFLMDNYDLNIVTCCNNVLKQIICELDDYDTFQRLERNFLVFIKRMIAQLIYLLQCEIKFFLKPERNIQIPYSQIVNNILSASFDQLIIRLINIKSVYGKTNAKYLLIYLNKVKVLSKHNFNNEIFPRSFEKDLLINLIQVISKLRKTLFTEFIPKISNEEKNWYCIYTNSFSQIQNCIWLPSLLESKARFKLAKIMISSFIYSPVDNYNHVETAITELKNSYYLSIESLIICYLILSGNTDEIDTFFKNYEKHSGIEITKFFNSRLITIYILFFNIYLNKFPDKNPLYNKIGFMKSQINDILKNINISYSNLSTNLAGILFYFYKSFVNLQSIKQFIILFITNKSFPINDNEIAEFKDLIKINSHSINNYNITEMINELIFDELNSSQTILKKNKLTQSIFTPIINQSFSYFSMINYILLEENSRNLLLYYQKFLLLNKKVMNFWGFETNKLINDHYNGLYLRRNRKYLCYKYKFMLVPSILILVIKNEITFDMNNILYNCINSETEIFACFNKDLTLDGRYSSPIFFPIYNSLLDTKCDNFANLSDISYYYLANLNQILDHLIDLLINEFKTIRQLPAVEKFEYLINDQIKNNNKKGINTNLIDIGIINWNDISESGHFNISLNIISKILNNILDIFNFVDEIALPVDGKLFSNLFGLVIIFYKYEIVGSEHNKSQLKSEFAQCIPLSIIKQLERQLGSFLQTNIPFSVIHKIGEIKVSLEYNFINIFNKCFTFSLDKKVTYTRNYFLEVVKLLIQFLGISSNGVNFVNLYSENSEGIEGFLFEEIMPEIKKRKRYDTSLFD
ncbi:unnamed protein product [Cryptosporidium hominis]|uniref:Uncharacterized protein n=2 Tax=Cryptosporidium hominis TaxID=237895 RepID=A0A0S4TGM8_CRYHO|nr:Uncharacterized protein GY17_00000201 [Cryptosporidium hominis]CUV06622.1 unnamed protein product [Cryptosporidium hominis]|eukprot:PPS97499.1 Uncharacterized protein GY17_00000201 [Cryptosporidium hominis]